MSRSEFEDERTQLQGAMSLLAALAGGLEGSLGTAASTVTYIAGKNMGRQFAARAEHTDNIEQALVQLGQILRENNCHWLYEAFQPKSHGGLVQVTAEGDEVMLVFRDCMIRQSLFRFGHPQRGALCNMMFGFFAGALERILQREANLEIVHAGENACYKKLLVQHARAVEAVR